MSTTDGLSLIVQPGGKLLGRICIPGDKSISHRAVMLGAIADGPIDVSGFLDGADCVATMDAFRAMGVNIEHPMPTTLRIHGVGMRGLQAASTPLDLGNSGTSMRLMTGLLAGQDFASVLRGDASLSKRPMRRIVDPLRSMGAHIETAPAGTAPLEIKPDVRLQAIEYQMPVASAQVKSSLLLAGLYATGTTVVHDPDVSRDHTERMLKAFGVELEVLGGRVAMRGGQRVRAKSIDVPADISSAAFFMVGAAIAPGSDLFLGAVGLNPTRAGIIEILRRMGAVIEISNAQELGGEPVADLRIRGSDTLRGIEIDRELVTLAIDEMPAIFIAAACAQGMTRISGAQELRIKESDRIAAMSQGLRSLGVDVSEAEDGAIITGGRLHGGTVGAFSDHRVAMSFAMAALRSDGEIRIDGCDNIGTSFPDFAGLARKTGLRIA